MKHLRIAVAATFAVLSGIATAQTMGVRVAPEQPTDAPRTFTQLDTDHDGTISPAEAQANPALSREFLMLDTNGNGVLEPSEFSRFEVTGAASTFGNPGSPGTSGNPAPPMESTPLPTKRKPPPNTSTPPPGGL